jgi:hypothetical protein
MDKEASGKIVFHDSWLQEEEGAKILSVIIFAMKINKSAFKLLSDTHMLAISIFVVHISTDFP